MMLLSAQTCSEKIVLEFAPIELKPCLVDITVYKHLKKESPEVIWTHCYSQESFSIEIAKFWTKCCFDSSY